MSVVILIAHSKLHNVYVCSRFVMYQYVKKQSVSFDKMCILTKVQQIDFDTQKINIDW